MLAISLVMAGQFTLFAQNISGEEKQISNQNVIEMGVEMLRRDAKFYVVVSSILIIFIFIAGYLFFMDKKISNLEKSKSNQ